MRFYTLYLDGKEKTAMSADGGKTVVTTEALGFDFTDMTDLIIRMPEEIARSKNLPSSAPAVDMEKAVILSPIVRPRQDMLCLGINYSEHASESARFHKEAFGGERPYTIYFAKRVSYSPGTGEAVSAYEGLVDSLDYEAELGVIIKDDTFKVSYEDAENHVFGYTVINDVSARNLQTRHKQWYFGKSLDGFGPMGPCIVTPDEIGDPKNLAISSRVNGELRQSSNTGNMIQTVAGAISELSAGMTLKAGSIIAMGTPAGVGMGFEPPRFLHPGDTVVCEIEKIGKLVTPIGK